MGKTVYKVQVGDEIIEFEGPDDLTDQQIQMIASGTDEFGEPIPEIVGGSVRDPESSSALGAFARGLPKDVLFNFGDEITAFGNAAIPGLAELDNAVGLYEGQQGPLDGGDFWERVKANQAALNEQAAADTELHPLEEGLGRIGGVVATLPRAAVALASRLPASITSRAAAAPILTTVGLGGAGGAVSGAGAGEGNRGQSAALGGFVGAGLGPVAWAAGTLGPAIANYAKIFFGKGGDKEAVGQIVKALKRDGFDVETPAGIAKVKTALQEFTGKPVSLADIGGAVRSRTGVGLRAPSDAQQPAIEQILARQAGQGQRIAKDIKANVAPRSDVYELERALTEQRSTEAQRLRDLALFEDIPTQHPSRSVPQVVPVPSPHPNAGVVRTLGGDVEDTYRREMVPAEEALPTTQRSSRVVDDPVLQQLARLPDAQKALTGALQRAESERALLAAQGMPTDHIPDLTRGSDLDVRTFDYLKRFLDDEVNLLYKRGQGSTFAAGEAAQVRALRDTIRERLRATVPEYADYLDQYSGSSKMIDALEEGRKFNMLDPEEIIAEQAARAPAAQELYRVGAGRDLLDTIMSTKDNANPASRILNSPESREQLLALGVDPANAAALNRSVSQERTLNLLPQELAGAQTAQRAMSQADANAGADLQLPFNPGSPLGWLGAVLRSAGDRVSVNRNAAVNAEILPRLTETNPTIIAGIIEELEAQGKTQAAALLRRRVMMNQAAITGGAVIGAPVALPGER